MALERLHLDFDLYRDPSDLTHVLVCFSQDYHAEQRHLIKSTQVPVSSASMVECIAKLASRLIEGSVLAQCQSPKNGSGDSEPVNETEPTVPAVTV